MGGILGGVDAMFPGAAYGLNPANEMISNRLGGKTEKERKKTLDEHFHKLKHDSASHSAGRYAKAFLPSQMAGGALVGGALGAYLGNHPIDASAKFFTEGDSWGNMASNAGMGAGAGALATGGLGALVSGTSGLIDSVIAKHLSHDSEDRAKKFKSKHPYSTSLPFGDMVGAATS